MRHLLSAACGLSLLCAQPVLADDVVVVELFTSQGCVACPPADAFFTALAQDPRVLPLALHVDYWDYIGWADSFAKPRFTERQKSYARAIGSRTIYTPQFIIGGTDRLEGYEQNVTEAAMAERLNSAPAAAVHLAATRAGDTLVIRAEAPAAFEAPVRVQLVRYEPEQTVVIERGENAGKTITYHNVVTEWTVLGDWSGAEPLDTTVSLTGGAPAVVILQAEGPGRILAAARTD